MMNIQELADKAIERINHRQTIGLEGEAGLQLVMPHRKQWASKRYLSGRNSPIGDYLSYCSDGEIINFEALDVLAWCVANGARGKAVIGGVEVDFSELMQGIKAEEGESKEI